MILCRETVSEINTGAKLCPRKVNTARQPCERLRSPGERAKLVRLCLSTMTLLPVPGEEKKLDSPRGQESAVRVCKSEKREREREG